MTLHNHRTPRNRQKVAQNMLQGVTVRRSYGDWTLPQVVLLMNVFVKELVVEKSMRVIKPNLINKNANSQIEDDFPKAWHFSEIFNEALLLLQVISYVSHRNTDEKLIEENCFHCVEQHFAINGFIRLRLNFVPSQCLWTQCHVHQSEDTPEEPINGE